VSWRCWTNHQRGEHKNGALRPAPHRAAFWFDPYSRQFYGRACYLRRTHMFNTNFLFASLIWSAIGFGYCVYAKKQRSWVPMVGGVLMIAASYLVSSILLMSLICLGLMATVFVMLKQGY